MKLLFDENLSRKLVTRLSELYPGSAHVAQKNGFIIVPTDADFYELGDAMGPPTKVYG